MTVSPVHRRVLLAYPRSFCAGVERAIQTVLDVLEAVGPPVYVRKQIVHNTHVVADLRAKGAVFVEDLAEVPDGSVVVFSAHGVAPAVVERAKARRLKIVDTTCPLVSKVHAEARRFAHRGNTILLIGHPEHEETEGTFGEAPDRTRIIQTPEDAAAVEVADLRRVSFLTQTTLALDETEAVVDALRERFPDLQAPADDDIATPRPTGNMPPVPSPASQTSYSCSAPRTRRIRYASWRSPAVKARQRGSSRTHPSCDRNGWTTPLSLASALVRRPRRASRRDRRLATRAGAGGLRRACRDRRDGLLRAAPARETPEQRWESCVEGPRLRPPHLPGRAAGLIDAWEDPCLSRRSCVR